MKRKNILFWVIILLSRCDNLLYSQTINLVSNPSFEQFYMDEQVAHCSDWILTNSVDYFSTQYKSNRDAKHTSATVPKNFAGYQNAQDGNAYNGFIFLYPKYKYREFLSTKLMAPLVKGATYDIEFYISLSDSSKYTTNSIIFWLSDKVRRTIKKNAYTLEATEPIELDNLNFDKENWTKVHYSYIAKGSEEFFTIGNCASCTSKWQYRKIIRKRREAKKSRDDNKYSVYYYVDNVSITKALSIPR
jgi:DNA-dependent RNA polymerase auxiliary subunit epsilon